MSDTQAGKLLRHHHVMNPLPPDMPCRDGRLFTIGRTENRGRPETELIICPSEFVSRQHCDIYYKNGAFWIKDLKSLNGTYLNGQKIIQLAERELRFGDIVGVGVSHDATDVDVRDPQYYIFTFKAQQFEIIDLDSEDEKVATVVQPHPVPIPQPNDVINIQQPANPVVVVAASRISHDEEEVEIVEEKLVSVPSSSPQKSSKQLPTPPPPPIISQPVNVEPRISRVQSVEVLASSSSTEVSDRTPSKLSSEVKKSTPETDLFQQPAIPKSSQNVPTDKTTLTEKKLPPKAGPASFKRKKESLQENQSSVPAGPSRINNQSVHVPTSNSPAAKIPKSPKTPESVTSFATVANNNSPPVSRPNLSPVEKQTSPHNKEPAANRLKSIDASTSDDSSDGMSESFSHQRFVPNVESSPEQTNHSKPAKKVKKTKRSAKFSNDERSSSKNRDDNRPSTSHSNKSSETKSKPKKERKLFDHLTNNLPVVRLRQLIVRDRRTGELNMQKKKFVSLSTENRQRIASQFELLYNKLNHSPCGENPAKHMTIGEDSNSDSSDAQPPMKKKKSKPRVDSPTSSGERRRPENNRHKKSKTSPIMKTKSTHDSDSSDDDEPKSKKAKRNSSCDKRRSSGEKALDKPIINRSEEKHQVESTFKYTETDQKPGSSRNLTKDFEEAIETEDGSLSPVSEDDDYDTEDDRMDTREDSKGEAEATEISPHYSVGQKKVERRTMQLISNPPPPPSVARRMDSARRRAQLDLDSRPVKIVQKGSFGAEDKETRIQKLKEVAARKANEDVKQAADIKRQPAPAGAKITPRNRNQDLIDSMMGLAEQTQKELERATTPRIEEPNQEKPLTIPAPRREIPLPSPKSQLKMPLQKIQKDMDRYNKSEEEAKKKLPPPQSFQPAVAIRDPRTIRSNVPSSSKNLSSNTNSIVVDYHHTSSVPVRHPSTSERAKVAEILSPISEDDVYKRLLKWRPIWLDEQRNNPEHPPVAENVQLVRTLYHYKDYTSYVEIFFPLILFEIWATVTQDFSNKRKSRDGSFESNVNEFPVKIEAIYKTQDCPMLRKKKKQVQKDEEKYWTQIACHGLTKKIGEISMKQDLAILTIKLQDTDPVTGKLSIRERDYFGFVLSNSEKDTPLSDPSAITDPQLQRQCPHTKYKHSMTVVIHLSNNEKVVMTELAKMKRVSYISPKLRDVKALNYLKYSKLMNHIINPGSPRVPYNPSVIPSQHKMIPHVSKLNATQKSVVSYVSDRVWSEDPDLLILHGPPGTGKTRTIVGMITQILLSTEKRNKSRDLRILVCTPSNTAVDEIMMRLEDAIKNDIPKNQEINMVRVGETYGSKMQKYTLDSLARIREDNSSTRSSIRDAIVQCDKEITDKNSEIQQLTEAPNHSKATLESLRRELKSLESRRDDYKSDFSKQRVDKSSFTTYKRQVLEKANVIFSTLNSCSNSFMTNIFGHQSGKNKPFLCCIVDEASQTTEPETLAPLLLQVDKLVLVGDPHQLGATVLSSEASQKDYGLSLFARLHHCNVRQNPGAVMMLTQQYRMHPEILAWPNEYFYKSQLKTHCMNRSEDDVCILKPYLFLNLPSQESSNRQGQISNDDEAKLVVDIIRNIGLMINTTRNQDAWSIGVITPYSTQKGAIKDSLRRELPTIARSVEVDTVDSFQGREKDIIIISCVRTDDTGFLKNPLRLNVALTRAKYSLLMIGDTSCLEKDDMWKSLISNAKERKCFYDVDPSEKSNPGFFKKRLYNLMSPVKSQIPEEQRRRDWLGT